MKYNPFKHMTDPENDNYDPCIQKISDTLETCTAYTLKDLNTHISPHMQNNFSAIFQNIDGNKTNFDAFILELERVSEKFQIVGLAETNVDVLESTVYQLEGYNCFYQNKHVSKIKGSGVALYVKENLNAVVSDELSWVTKNLETLFITVQHDEPLHIGVLYRPPSGDSTEALNELRKIIEMCPKNNVYILGDFNINMHDNSSSLVDDFENIIFGLGLAPLISISTHEKPGCKQTCIDNIITNDIESLLYSGTLNTCISHHHAVFNIFKSPIITNTNNDSQKIYQYYDYNNKNVDRFVNQLESKLSNEPPEDFSDFFSVFNEQLDNACKLDRPKFSKRTAKVNPWITQGLITSIDKKHELHNTWKEAKKRKCLSPTTPELVNCRGRCFDCYNCITEIASHKEFTTHRRALNHLINCAKRKYHSGKIAECVGDSKKTWQIINEIRGKKRREIKPNFVIDNERVTSRRVIANEFNKYFASIASNLNETYSSDLLRISSLPSFTDYLPTSISSSIYLRDCDCQEIKEIISELKNGKSSDIPIHVIKKSCTVIAPYLVKYFNKCMQDGYFPCELKTGRISPIYKKEDEQLLENYRPVSTLPVVSQTKFLGVTIDDKLNWRPHIHSLNNKLRSICGRIYRIKQCLPESLYKQIYHSLFESHLGYAISVWGGISSNQLKPLFVTQKKCVRILFGDFEKYVDKFKTCARTRPINKQNLGSKFYEKESTKPLFTRHELLAVENLYRSRCIMEMFKTVKLHVPVSLCCLFNPSTRKDSLLITPNPTHQFIYKSAWLWNQFRNTTSFTFSSKYSAVKNYLRQSLLGAQSRHGTEWNNFNFTEF